MYIELKTFPEGQDDHGPAWIGRVYFNSTGGTLTYKGKKFQKYRGGAGNFFDIDTNEVYWITGPKKNGEDRYPWARRTPVLIDEDVQEEYWGIIRNLPNRDKANLSKNTY